MTAQSLRILHLYQNPQEPLTEDDKTLLFDMASLDEDEVNDDRTKALEEYLKKLYAPRVEAAYCVASGMSAQLGVQGLQALQAEQSFQNISRKIQGEPFDAALISQRVSVSSQNAVVRQKAEWLKEFIRTQDEAWVKRLLLFVKG